MNNNETIIHGIIEHIRKAESIIICSHIEPDGDAYGSQFGLWEILRSAFPEKAIRVSGNIPPAFEIFPAPPEVPDSLFPSSLVIITDTSTDARVAERRWKTGGSIIKIDHHPREEILGIIDWVDTTYPSCAEMITDLARIGGMTIPATGARMLYLGITTDTGRFRFPGVGEETFRRASILCAAGVDPAEVYDLLYNESEEVLRFQGNILRNFQRTDAGLAYMKITPDMVAEYGITPGRACGMVNLLSGIKGIGAWVFFCEDAQDRDIRVEFRSRFVAVNTVAVKYGGGGHRHAAGTRVTDWSVADAIIADLDTLLQEAG